MEIFDVLAKDMGSHWKFKVYYTVEERRFSTLVDYTPSKDALTAPFKDDLETGGIHHLTEPERVEVFRYLRKYWL